MHFLTGLIQSLPLWIVDLPVLLMAFSVHESAHGYVALKLGDPTARNLGRITLNPLKHLDPIGFLCMLIAHVGWAKPVPINARNFRKPRRDMALTGAAGPASNLILAVLHLLALRVMTACTKGAFLEESIAILVGQPADVSPLYTALSVLAYLLWFGIVINVSLALFNLIPVPPFDGSRIFYAALPPKWYFGVMKYERIIMAVLLVVFMTGLLSRPLGAAESWVLRGLFTLSGMGRDARELLVLNGMLLHIQHLLTIPL